MLTHCQVGKYLQRKGLQWHPLADFACGPHGAISFRVGTTNAVLGPVTLGRKCGHANRMADAGREEKGNGGDNAPGGALRLECALKHLLSRRAKS
jgi:hypothetical protein